MSCGSVKQRDLPTDISSRAMRGKASTPATEEEVNQEGKHPEYVLISYATAVSVKVSQICDRCSPP